MTAFHVRRDKATCFQWVQGRPGDSLPPEAITTHNTSWDLEKDDVQADPTVESGKADTAG